jgi:hypothetical protein
LTKRPYKKVSVPSNRWAFQDECIRRIETRIFMTTTTTPAQPADSFRIAINLEYAESRIDNVLLNALREQNENDTLKAMSRTLLKDLFANKKIMIKGQRAKSSSALAKGTTYVDILGY